MKYVITVVGFDDQHIDNANGWFSGFSREFGIPQFTLNRNEACEYFNEHIAHKVAHTAMMSAFTHLSSNAEWCTAKVVEA